MTWTQEQYIWRRDNGIGDYIFNNLTKIIMDGDKSTWAVLSFIYCAVLLDERKRWPDYLNRSGDAPNRYLWHILKMLYSYRSQDDMTRDPFIAFGACYTHLLGGRHDDLLRVTFESVTIPWYLYRVTVFKWRKRLISDNSKFYVKRLRYLRALATVKYFEMNYKLWKR